MLGGLKIHALSTEKIDLLAEWDDPFDDLTQPRLEGQDYLQKNTAQADEIPIPSTQEGIITTGSGSANYRQLAYYDADHDLLCFARDGDRLGNLGSGVTVYGDTAPRHYFNDTRYHRVQYTARATSRFREYFPQDQDLDFTRSSAPIIVEVPASARPAAPVVSYVVPTFGWQRQTQTNLKRSVRFGGGLRVVLERPWFSSGDWRVVGRGALRLQQWLAHRPRAVETVHQPVGRRPDLERPGAGRAAAVLSLPEQFGFGI